MNTKNETTDPKRQTSPGGKRTAIGNPGGFTLLEVLVALIVLAVGATVTMSAISGSMGNIRKGQSRTRIMEDAQTIMESALYREDMQNPITEADELDNGTRYVIEVAEYNPETDLAQQIQSGPNLPIKMLQYTVEMIGPDSSDPVYRLQSLKLVSTAQQVQQSTTQ